MKNVATAEIINVLILSKTHFCVILRNGVTVVSTSIFDNERSAENYALRNAHNVLKLTGHAHGNACADLIFPIRK